MNTKKIFVIFFFILINFHAFSQEFTTTGAFGIDNSEYQIVENRFKEIDTLELPFIEDFSKTFPYQNTKLWLDRNVLITRTAANYPPSIGAAVFDAVDISGNYYTTAYNSAHSADTLTSLPINLDYPGDNTIYLSFFFQAQGLMDKPEVNDSLLLQFYSPLTEQWTTKWYSLGKSVSDFEQVIVPVNESDYLQKGFQFRFVNWASLGSPTVPSLVGNCDFWFVDYIRLDRNRNENDLVIPELAFQYPPTFKINEYEMMPYEHYKSNPTKENFTYSYNLKYRNNDNVVRSIDSIYILFDEIYDRVETSKLLCGSFNTNSSTNAYLNVTNISNFSFPVTGAYILDYNVKAVLITNSEDSTFNNVVSVRKPLSGYYAYDDGSAEIGWGIYGDGANQGTAAAKYYTYKADTLTGIQFYINKTFRDEQPTYFDLVVWSEDTENNMPGEIIYQEEGLSVEALNQYKTYYFETPFVVSGNFYVGWRNIGSDLLNVGLDLNTSSSHKYFNIYGYWQQSSINGEMMVRPIFGNSEYLPVEEIEKVDFSIYPNPAKDYINITTNLDYFTVNIYDIYGRLVYVNEDFNETKISVNDLNDGVYIVRIITDNEIVESKKIIIKH